MEDSERRQFLNRLCPCCALDPEMVDLPLCCDPIELTPYGSGYPVYFNMLKFAGSLCVVLALFNIYKLVVNMNSNTCTYNAFSIINFSAKQKDQCVQDWITVHSVVNYGPSNVDINDKYIMLAFLVVYYLMIAIYQAYLDRLSATLQQSADTASHWSVQVYI